MFIWICVQGWPGLFPNAADVVCEWALLSSSLVLEYNFLLSLICPKQWINEEIKITQTITTKLKIPYIDSAPNHHS